MIDSWMGNDSQEFVNAGPGDCPRNRTLSQVGENLTGDLVVRARANLSVDEDICVNGLHALPAIHEIEELVAIQDVDTRLKICVPSVQFQAK